MGWRPQLNVVCNRCGKPHGLFGVCVNPRNSRQGFKPRLSFGSCPTCRKPYGAAGPAGHVCAARSDFRKRKKQFAKDQAAKGRKSRPAHDYTECSDQACKRSRCVAYKAGLALGEDRGFERGWDQGYERGIIECPRDHK